MPVPNNDELDADAVPFQPLFASEKISCAERILPIQEIATN